MIRKSRSNPYHSYQHAMTLLEILLVMAVLGILSALAYPSYTQYVMRHQRQQAITDMARIQLYLDSRPSLSQAINTISEQGRCGAFCQASAPTYQIHIEQQARTYTIIASPRRQQTHDTCQGEPYEALILRSNGEHAPTACW